jgi:hypothetical protein
LHNFTCSSGWLWWFVERHDIINRELCGGVVCVEPLSGLPENTQASRRQENIQDEGNPGFQLLTEEKIVVDGIKDSSMFLMK